MKITKKLREEAALCAGVLACTPDSWGWEYAGCADIASFNLAWDTFKAVRRHYLGDRWWSGVDIEYMAEAEAMLRTGFVPEGWE